ncbi:phiSA1p31-related protein [Streptomyces longwoodensis]|uniref:phiSA1p31-related protein n=1 Tax=Streptomyces longwoodensis TaxID=68231 RepID=UPI00340BC1BD
MIGMDIGPDGEPVIVVVVRADGSHTVRVGDVCPVLAAELLRGIADRIIADHAPIPYPVTPQAEQLLDAEPAGPDAGRLDQFRSVWHDPAGNVFDLTLRWADAQGLTWHWHGDMDPVSGVPMLTCDQWPGKHPLDVLRAGRGPIRPVLDGAA